MSETITKDIKAAMQYAYRSGRISGMSEAITVAKIALLEGSSLEKAISDIKCERSGVEYALREFS